MEQSFSLSPVDMQKLQTAQELRDTNDLTSKFGLSLTDAQIHGLVEKRYEALRDTGRIEFGQGILKKLLFEFCDSPYIDSANYEEVVWELVDSFYYFKNESDDLIPDDELIAIMKDHYDNRAHGSLEYLNGTSLEDLCRNTRYGYETDDDTDVYGNQF